MKLIFALGNPGPEYARSRHNLGFVVVDAYARQLGATLAPKDKFRAEVAEVLVGSEKVILAKPTTFYNLAGQSFRAIMDYFDIEPSDCVIVHDELDLPIGTVRARDGGSSAGNNGVKSIVAHGGEAAHRLRIGIAPAEPRQGDDRDYVLSGLSKAEAETFDQLLPKILEHLGDFVEGAHSSTTHRAE